MPKEKPIIFSTEMVKAVLTCAKCGQISEVFPCKYCGSKEFIKTQTRRVIKDGMDSCDIIGAKYIRDNLWNPIYQPAPANAGRITHTQLVVSKLRMYFWVIPQLKSWFIKSPYQVGDRLWVRENIRTICYPYQDGKFAYGAYLIEYMANKQLVICPDKHIDWWRHNWHIRPSITISSIFMPKWATRIWLEVTNLRAERLQDISTEDAEAEGIRPRNNNKMYYDYLRKDYCRTYCITSFQSLWDSLNAKRGFSWKSNPWVWVIEFKRINYANKNKLDRKNS